jgi:hypothetical protein
MSGLSDAVARAAVRLHITVEIPEHPGPRANLAEARGGGAWYAGGEDVLFPRDIVAVA